MHDVKVKDVVLKPIKRWCNGDQVQKIKMMVDRVLKMKLTNLYCTSNPGKPWSILSLLPLF
jgi:hypothetical protein